MAATKPRDDCTHGVIISELVPQDSSTTPGQELKNGGAIFLSSAEWCYHFRNTSFTRDFRESCWNQGLKTEPQAEENFGNNRRSKRKRWKSSGFYGVWWKKKKMLEVLALGIQQHMILSFSVNILCT